ncbi:quinone oxidoreductase [Aquicoccus sp. G2-2]|uniref:quinone oxidoreductase family protein n=1 Tax=Aquicoccus sp. G2-2 TaxID=3092120 RepID=UPI002ADFC035|nr:quinone oxidoreductase [Aquicoccus sp. G2-2]MEA1113222.1 quinone oxidoreductase [Aquicoccus sp. G2-2]
MAHALVCSAPGGPDTLVWTQLSEGAPGSGEVLLRQTAIGVNFIDIYYRTGLYPWPTPTLIPGAEAAGVIEAVGPDVTGFAPGDRVAYITPFGAYREMRILPAEQLVRLPDGIAPEVIAGALLKGLTAQYLVTASYPVRRGDVVLVHAAAGGVGLILGQWLAALGVEAIGTAGGPEKVALAKTHGYAHVIDYRTEDFVAEVTRITGGKGCAAVYDSVGADTWRGSLACLARRGHLVNFGQSSGMITGFALADLAKGSLTATRPMLFDFISERAELLERSADLFSRILDGTLKFDVAQTRRLREAGAVHEEMEARKTVGSTVLLP